MTIASLAKDISLVSRVGLAVGESAASTALQTQATTEMEASRLFSIFNSYFILFTHGQCATWLGIEKPIQLLNVAYGARYTSFGAEFPRSG